jgi:DNA-binding MarR family transcriptional regulator/N-acetylglutamate synthase-like GNAT family acetyltransferase
MSANSILERRIHAVRQFNRLYTRQIGLLRDGFYKSLFSLTEVRVLYELAHRKDCAAKDLVNDLNLDPGYLSRILKGFEKKGLITRTGSDSDGRQSLVRLTAQGRKTFARLDSRSQREIGDLLQRLSEAQQKQLVEAMSTIGRVLEGHSSRRPGYVLRTHQPGDMGWVVQRHGALYWQEYGYDERFEALVAEIVAGFIRNFDPRRERCWIAEVDGGPVGSIFLVKKSRSVAKLRLLLVEPSARGMGIGRRLVEECVRFARQAGYKKIVLWTQSELHAARHLYQEAGFRRTHHEAHASWSRSDLVSEVWELKLG